MIATPPEKLLTLQEVADRLGFSIDTIRRHLAELPHSRIFGKPRIRQSDLAEWVAVRSIRPRSTARSTHTTHTRKAHT